MTHNSHPRGFTLMEVTIALAIFGLLVTLVYESFVQTLDSQEIVTADAEAYHAARVIMDRLNYELTNTYVRRDGLFVAEEETNRSNVSRRRSRLRKTTDDEESQTVFVGKHSGGAQHSMDVLNFTATANFVYSPDSQESDLVQIIYYVVENRDGGANVLRRREYKIPQGNIEIGRDPCTPEQMCTEYDVYAGILGFGFRYYTDDRFGDRFDQDEWDSVSSRDSDQFSRVPRAIEITLVLESGAGSELIFRTIVAIPAGISGKNN